MFLALAELRRAKARFGLLVGAVALLAFLILAQQALRDSLLRQFVGGIRNQSAPVLVFNVDGRRFLQASSIPPELEAAVRDVPGVAVVGRIWQGTYPVSIAGEVEAVSVAAWDTDGAGSPARLTEGRFPSASGEVVANAEDADRGFALGDRLRVEPTGVELTVVGLADDVGLNVAPTVWSSFETYVAVAQTRNPELGPDLRPNALGVRPADGVAASELATRINTASPDLDALTRDDAADGNPGVESITLSFGVIFVLFAAVVPLAVGLFFLILTTQKAPSLTVLRAAGAPSRRLVGSVLVQVGVVLAAGIVVATVLYGLFSRLRVDGLAVAFDGRAVLTWAAALGVLGLLSAVASVRRVLAVEPAVALGGGLDR